MMLAVQGTEWPKAQEESGFSQSSASTRRAAACLLNNHPAEKVCERPRLLSQQAPALAAAHNFDLGALPAL